MGASKPKYQNMRYTNHQYMTKVFQFLQKRLGMSATHATFSMQAYKTNVLIWRMFMPSSMKAAIHLVPNSLPNSEIYKNTIFEDIESLLNITQQLALERSEDMLNVNWLEYSSPSWTRSVLANDQAIKHGRRKKYVSMLNPLCVLDR